MIPDSDWMLVYGNSDSASGSNWVPVLEPGAVVLEPVTVLGLVSVTVMGPVLGLGVLMGAGLVLEGMGVISLGGTAAPCADMDIMLPENQTLQ